MPDRCELPLTICKQIACMVETDSVDGSPAKERARVTANATEPWPCFVFSEEGTRAHHRHSFPQHVPILSVPAKSRGVNMFNASRPES